MGTKAPSKCPACGSISDWVCTGESKKGISAGKAVGGAIIAGPVGAVVGGALGKRKYTYYCRSCNFREDYDEKKDPQPIPLYPKNENQEDSDDDNETGYVLFCIALAVICILIFLMIFNKLFS